MPRKKRKTFKRKSTRSTASKTSRRRSKGSSRNAMITAVVGGMIYGAGREYVSDKLAPLTARVPAGALADEVVMGAASYFLAKGKIPFLNKIKVTRDIGRAGLMIEAARTGAYLADTFTGGKATTTSTNSLQVTVN